MLGFVRAPIDLALAVAKGGVSVGVAAVRAAVGLIDRGQEDARWDIAVRPEPGPSAAASAPPGAEAAPPAAKAAPPTPVAPPPPPAEDHVSEQPVQVAAFAEPGVEDGAGAELEIAPPWDGYDREDARSIAQKLRDADAATVAAVDLYESANKQRRGVLDAAQRRLKQLSAPAAGRNR